MKVHIMNSQKFELPTFIDQYIFNKLGAKYAPDFEKFNKNLEHNKEEVLEYLGTYFPRSFAESYLIFNNIFTNKTISNIYPKQEDINILDIGSGTGGNLSGLLYSFIEQFGTNFNFNIFVVDGNQEALQILGRIVQKFQLEYDLRISIRSNYITFETICDLYQEVKQHFEVKFDFIISSKMINEIIAQDRNAYYDFYEYFIDELKDKGLLMLIDVTAKIKEWDYLPIILNKQTNKFITNYKEDYKTLIPTSCSVHEINCTHNCFSNQLFSLTHSNKQNDLSKITYRVIGKIDFVESILSHTKVADIIGQTENGCKYCQCITDNLNENAFELKT